MYDVCVDDTAEITAIYGRLPGQVFANKLVCHENENALALPLEPDFWMAELTGLGVCVFVEFL